MNSKIDHTLLKPWMSSQNVETLCREAIKHRFRGVCVFSRHIQQAKALLDKEIVSAVIDFPFGLSVYKDEEAYRAVCEGADELDVVWNLAKFKAKEYSQVVAELKRIVELGVPVKVIVESCFLDVVEQTKAYQIVKDSGAFCIKTSTGVYGGASVETVQLWNRLGDLKIKASGDIDTWYRANELIRAGADIIGTSKGVELVTIV